MSKFSSMMDPTRSHEMPIDSVVQHREVGRVKNLTPSPRNNKWAHRT
jgi:hypothetical protein